jgi:CHAT domain-containing protein
MPLIADHEIVGLPSASALATLRSRLASREPAPGSLAILADPVFSKDDQRVEVGSATGQVIKTNPVEELQLTRSAAQLDLFRDRANWSRLPFSRREAEQILTLVPRSDARAAFDFDASQATAMSEELSKYRILHFATHGVLNNEIPEMSGLVLSLVNKKGVPQDGFLSLSEISNLSLKAELVVLSACRTGLGKQIRGEGLLGLTRGFMYAGAPRIVASLWAVQDRATLELMARFYRAMFKQGLHPAAALREAQVSMWREGKWCADQWAGFVFQGDWQGESR